MGLTFKKIEVLSFRRRLLLLCLVICLALAGAIPMARVLSYDGWTTLKVAFLGLFLLLQMQVAFGFAGALIGWVVLRFGRDPIRISREAMASEPPTEFPAVAIVMPVYNEEVSRIFQGLRIVYESLEKTG